MPTYSYAHACCLAAVRFYEHVNPFFIRNPLLSKSQMNDNQSRTSLLLLCSQATVSSYVSECCSGRPLRLHICLLTGEETEGQTEAQTHHATREETAGALRELAQAGNGRFHWISETGTREFTHTQSVLWKNRLLHYQVAP